MPGSISKKPECLACELAMLKTTLVRTPLYVIGMAADESLWGIWAEHGTATKGYVSVLLVHLDVLADKIFGKDRWVMFWKHEYDHLCYRVMLLENGQ